MGVYDTNRFKSIIVLLLVLAFLSSPLSVSLAMTTENSWETMAPMPTPRMSLDANVVNGKIYMIGGFNYTWPYYSLDENEVYDPSTDSWTTKASILNATQSYSSAVVDNKIYIIGGGGSSLNQIYNPATDIWSYGVSLPTEVDSAAAGATTGVMAPKRIYVIGGKRDLDAVNLNQIYDPETDTWNTGTAMPTARYGLGVTVVNDVLYAIGGVTGWMAPVTATNDQYTPIGYIPEFPSWTPILLILIGLAIAVAIYKRKLPKTGNTKIILGD